MARLMFIVLIVWSQLSLVAAEKLVGQGVTLYPKEVSVAPVIDGKIDDPAWAGDPLVNGPFITNSPVYGEKSTQQTRVWMVYDQNNIYLAFYCHDTEPEKIKASISRRDNPFNDDWVGVDLDTLGNRQSVHEIICNPLGMQADLINTAASGESADPDWIWYSAGQVVSDGYIVEIKLPFKSFKFQSGKDIQINVAFYRYISRTGTNSSWPQIDQERGYFNSLIPTVLNNMHKQLRLEALPSFTYGSLWDRLSPESWSGADDSAQFGIGLKYGVTSSIDAELTFNPDFSQVESDQFQVEANQRYPLFYNEKRPFFMDVASQFSLAGLHSEGNFWTAVHTRQIVDPAWGAKVTGDFGKTSFGLLFAGDEWPGREWPGEQNPNLGQNANTMIGRVKYSLKGDNFIGLLYSGRTFAEGYNHAIAADANLRVFGKHSLAMNAIFSFSRENQTLEKSQGAAASILYQYGQKPLDLFFFFEHMGENFRMDSAFYQRTGITKLTGYIGPKFYPNFKPIPWLKVFNPFVYGVFSHDIITGKDDTFFFPSLRFNFSRQGMIRFDYRFINEYWTGRFYNQQEFVMMANAKPTSWLTLMGNMRLGNRLYYDETNPFMGRQHRWTLALSLQPNSRFTQEFEYTHQHFDRDIDKNRIYDLNILVSRTTFQFNKHLFLRALVQYDSYASQVLSDVLASFTLIPGTVLHLGYGSLHQSRYWNPDLQEWRNISGLNRYYQTTQSLFFKASYLLRL